MTLCSLCLQHDVLDCEYFCHGMKFISPCRTSYISTWEAGWGDEYWPTCCVDPHTFLWGRTLIVPPGSYQVGSQFQNSFYHIGLYIFLHNRWVKVITLSYHIEMYRDLHNGWVELANGWVNHRSQDNAPYNAVHVYGHPTALLPDDDQQSFF